MLAEKTVLTNGCIVNTHERLVRACNMLNTRLCAGDLFTYLNLEVTKQAIVPAFNNQIESCNARLRAICYARIVTGCYSTVSKHACGGVTCIHKTRCPYPSSSISCPPINTSKISTHNWSYTTANANMLNANTTTKPSVGQT